MPKVMQVVSVERELESWFLMDDRAFCMLPYTQVIRTQYEESCDLT